MGSPSHQRSRRSASAAAAGSRRAGRDTMPIVERRQVGAQQTSNPRGRGRVLATRRAGRRPPSVPPTPTRSTPTMGAREVPPLRSGRQNSQSNSTGLTRSADVPGVQVAVAHTVRVARASRRRTTLVDAVERSAQRTGQRRPRSASVQDVVHAPGGGGHGVCSTSSRPSAGDQHATSVIGSPSTPATPTPSPLHAVQIMRTVEQGGLRMPVCAQPDGQFREGGGRSPRRGVAHEPARNSVALPNGRAPAPAA